MCLTQHSELQGGASPTFQNYRGSPSGAPGQTTEPPLGADTAEDRGRSAGRGGAGSGQRGASALTPL